MLRGRDSRWTITHSIPLSAGLEIINRTGHAGLAFPGPRTSLKLMMLTHHPAKSKVPPTR